MRNTEAQSSSHNTIVQLPSIDDEFQSHVYLKEVNNDHADAENTFDNAISRYVMIGEGGLTFTHCEHPIIGSYSANPSVIMAVHSPTYQVSAIAHIDDTTNIEKAVNSLTEEVILATKEIYDFCKSQAADVASSRSRLQEVLYVLSTKMGLAKETLPIHPRDPNLPPLSVHLCSGSKQLNKTLNELRGYISNNSKLALKSVHQQPGFAIDSRDGKIYAGDFAASHFSGISSTAIPLPKLEELIDIEQTAAMPYRQDVLPS